MIALGQCLVGGVDFGVHCATKEEVQILVNYIYEVYPEKKNMREDLLNAWDRFGYDTVIFPNILNCNWAMAGRVGGNASRKRKIYEFYELKTIDDLPIEQSDMDLCSMLGL